MSPFEEPMQRGLHHNMAMGDVGGGVRGRGMDEALWNPSSNLQLDGTNPKVGLVSCCFVNPPTV